LSVVINFVSRYICVISLVSTYSQQDNEELDEDLHYWGVVVFFVCFVAWVIADLFLEVYDMTIDTIFICWAEDSDHNNGQVRLVPVGGYWCWLCSSFTDVSLG
jgi:solute carrier family 44 protein 1 (choline transporter-like protein)/choline transporter-like protein 2/4/5